jgi:hypothetical protein
MNSLLGVFSFWGFFHRLMFQTKPKSKAEFRKMDMQSTPDIAAPSLIAYESV